MTAEATFEALITPRTRDLGDGFMVRRALPAPQRRLIGPFIFFDQMGPARFSPGQGLDVRPHPHIGLATVTYLFDGEIMHRDSLGTVQSIRPGEVNWMTAGRGIVHSERTGPGQRAAGSQLSGIQAWVALPKALEERAPSFSHHDAMTLPQFEDRGVSVRLIAGSLQGKRAPVPVSSEMFYADAKFAAGATFELSTEHEERAIYALSGRLDLNGGAVEPGQLAVLRPQSAVALRAVTAARVLLLGGAPLDGERHIWWNFVSSSIERIRQAAIDWRAGRFERVPNDPEFIPLPHEAEPTPTIL
jgi:redox-sensitive bicupin YhaK (pirin superfamily)